MGKLAKIKPVSDLRQDAATVLKELKGSHDPVIITQRGRAAAVLMSVASYERAEHERELLRLLARGAREIAAGEGYALDDVFAEADALLSGE